MPWEQLSSTMSADAPHHKAEMQVFRLASGAGTLLRMRTKNFSLTRSSLCLLWPHRGSSGRKRMQTLEEIWERIETWLRRLRR